MSTTLAKEKSKFEQGEPSEELKPWLRRFGRFGHMVKGSVYTMLGLLAFMASIGAGGKAQGTKGLFQSSLPSLWEKFYFG
ncbi:hypothetical protein [Halobacillus andaensis]|uniref:hypothetical protein n=1 Tax=Halobacillus andaensis TaxID=1176239 RepID=UPI003D70F40D